LQLAPTALPTITQEPVPVLSSFREQFGLPATSFVFPAMADLYASLHGLNLNDREGFMLANTSEQAGVFFLDKPTVHQNFLHISFRPGYINYGSTNTGANLVSWFVGNVLQKELSPGALTDLTRKAEAIRPEETPIVLPYLQGERAPLWNSKLTASVLQLRSSHTDAHLFRAVLEAIAFARRQCFEQLGLEALNKIKLAGGSSKNNLWNAIRATVLNKPVAVASEKELALTGLINYMIDAEKSGPPKPCVNFSFVEPQSGLIEAYEEKYRQFIHFQNLLS
jgi:sugar (pentulose or hexulose) kinase